MSENVPPESQESKISFFRQSGWMMIATFLMGVCMWAVHRLSNYMSPAEYETGFTMLRLLMIMAIPAGALQMVFAKYTSAAVSEDEKDKLATAFRTILKFGTLIWGLVFLLIAFLQDWICTTWQLTGPAAIWSTCAAGLTWFWWAVMIGVIQGRQNFLWYGFASIFNGVGRVIVAACLVLLLDLGGSGIMLGAWFGLAVSAATAAWHARDLFSREHSQTDWSRWLRDLFPLAIFGAIMAIHMTADTAFIQSRFPGGQIAPYNTTSVLALALISFTIPISGVMYPKIIRSIRLDEKSNALLLTVITTALIAAVGACALSLGPLVKIALHYGFSEKYVSAAKLVPWFAWAMVPLTITNVLIAHLLANTRYRVLGVLGFIAIGYLFTLWYTVPYLAPGTDLMPHFKQVIQTIGIFNLILLLFTAAFCLLESRRSP